MRLWPSITADGFNAAPAAFTEIACVTRSASGYRGVAPERLRGCFQLGEIPNEKVLDFCLRADGPAGRCASSVPAISGLLYRRRRRPELDVPDQRRHAVRCFWHALS